MKEKRIWFKSKDGLRLCGTLTVLSKTAKGVVILAHGITAEKNETGSYKRLARLLAKNHLTSLRFDFRAHGKSSGKFHKITIKGELDDLLAAVNFLKKKGYKKFAIVGTSFGAGVAVLYAGKRSRKITSLTLLCPVLDYRRTFLEPETRWAKKWFTPYAISRAHKTGSLNLGGFRLGAALLREFKRHKPGEMLLKFSIPVLIAHGTEDKMVPYKVARYYAKKYPRGKFISVKGADHGLKAFEKKVFPKIVNWILKHLEK